MHVTRFLFQYAIGFGSILTLIVGLAAVGGQAFDSGPDLAYERNLRGLYADFQGSELYIVSLSRRLHYRVTDHLLSWKGWQTPDTLRFSTMAALRTNIAFPCDLCDFNVTGGTLTPVTRESAQAAGDSIRLTLRAGDTAQRLLTAPDGTWTLLNDGADLHIHRRAGGAAWRLTYTPEPEIAQWRPR